MHFCAYVHVCMSHSCSDGQKMSKRKKNYPDPGLIVQNYGADALRSDLCLNASVLLKHECLCAGGRILCFYIPYVISMHGFKSFESLSTLK